MPVASDTSIASQLTQEEKIQLAIKALRDGTIPSQRKAAITIYNVPRTTLQQRFHGRRSTEESQQSQQRLSVREEDSIGRCIITMTSWGWPVSIKYLESLIVGLLHTKGDNEPLGQHWYKNFLTRHPDLKTTWSRSLRRRDAEVPAAENPHRLMPLRQGSAATQTTNFRDRSCPAPGMGQGPLGMNALRFRKERRV